MDIDSTTINPSPPLNFDPVEGRKAATGHQGRKPTERSRFPEVISNRTDEVQEAT